MIYHIFALISLINSRATDSRSLGTDVVTGFPLLECALIYISCDSAGSTHYIITSKTHRPLALSCASVVPWLSDVTFLIIKCTCPPSSARARLGRTHPFFPFRLSAFLMHEQTHMIASINISGRRAPPQMRYIIAAENYIKLFLCAHFPARGIKMWERAPGAIELPASDICMHRVTFSPTRLFAIGSFNAGKEKLDGFLRCSLSNGILDQWGIIYI
jgi:hypothetical protein